MNGGTVIFNFTGDTKDIEKKVNKVSGGFSGLGKKIVGANLVTGLISKGFNAVSNSMDGAISRVDILNNFPKVMNNLGISTEEAQKGISTLSDKLTGLPTTLDAGASAVQRLVSKNSNIKKSTDMFLALNNAILAGGAGPQIQASALEQLSQAYAKGKPDMMEWRTMQMAMPAQLNQVAKAFGMTATELGEAMRDKDPLITMDMFMEKVMELNTKGANGFMSFEEQARNATGGIRTSMTNMKTAIVRGTGSILTSFNEVSAKEGLLDFGGLIRASTGGIKGFFNTINSLIKGEDIDIEKKMHDITLAVERSIFGSQQLPQYIKMGTNIIKSLLNGLMKALPGLLNIGLLIITQVIQGIASALPSVVTTFVEMIPLLINSFVAQIPMLTATGLQILLALTNGIMNGLPTFLESLPQIVTSFIEGIKDHFPQILTLGLNILWSLIKGIALAIPSLFKSAWEIVKIIWQTLGELNSKIKEIGGNIIKGLWNGIKGMQDWIRNKIKDFGKSVLKSIKGVFGVHSPSTEFEFIGKMNVLGLEKGLNDSKNRLQGAFDSIFDLSPNLYGTNSLNMSPVVNVTVNNSFKQDPLGQMVNDIRMFSGGSKNDYNYGLGD